jgi:hypothetical protein
MIAHLAASFHHVGNQHDLVIGIALMRRLGVIFGFERRNEIFDDRTYIGRVERTMRI